MSHSSRLAGVRFNPLVGGGGQTPPPCSQQEERRSPVNFREGRRSSDGLVAQGLVAFHQRLQDTPGQLQLQQVREEAKLLQSKYSELGPPVPSLPATKRISLPENFTYFPSGPSGQSGPASLSKHVALQQQLLQHRLYQKRQNLQKQRIIPDPRRVHPHPHPHSRQQTYPKPYLPTEQGPDCLFQPIAEDEPAWQGLPSSMQGCHVSELQDHPQPRHLYNN